MAFEHYRRSGSKMLRCGYTTGTCAALAASAATQMLLTGEVPEAVRLMTGKGIPVEVPITEFGWEDGIPWAAVPKDAGDDIDVTDGLLIRAAAERTDEPGIRIDGGKGVGRVTKPGLDQPVGNAAINSGPRKMITEAVQRVCDLYGAATGAGTEPAASTEPAAGAAAEAGADAGGILITVSVPEGEEAAKRTFNANLGIVGGISILGTTGIVEPMREQALVDTIEVELKQIALSSDRLIMTPGNYGSSFIEGHDLDEMGVPVLKFSNFLGETLDMIAGTGMKEVLLVAHVGKLSKVAAAVMNTHSRYADGRNEIFTAHTAVCGGGTRLCQSLMHAATTDACIELLDEAGLREPVIQSILQAVQQKLEHRTAGRYRIGAIMFSNVYGLLGMTEEGAKIFNEWEECKV